jgi:hypothetical protein
MLKNIIVMFALFCLASMLARGQEKLVTDPNASIPSVPTCKLYVTNADLNTPITVRFAQTTFRQIGPRQWSKVAEVSRIPQLGGYTISRTIDSSDLRDSTGNATKKRTKKWKIGALLVLADEDVPQGSEYYFGSGTYIAVVTHLTSGDAISISTDSLEDQTDTLVLSRKDHWDLAVRRYNRRLDGALPDQENYPLPIPGSSRPRPAEKALPEDH